MRVNISQTIPFRCAAKFKVEWIVRIDKSENEKQQISQNQTACAMRSLRFDSCVVHIFHLPVKIQWSRRLKAERTQEPTESTKGVDFV